MSSALTVIVLGNAFFNLVPNTSPVQPNCTGVSSSTQAPNTPEIPNIIQLMTEPTVTYIPYYDANTSLQTTSAIDPVTESTIPVTDPSIKNDTREASPLSGHYKIVCYFANWGSSPYMPEDVADGLCTHIVLGVANLDGSDLVIKPHSSWMDSNDQFYRRLLAHKQNGGPKILLGLGGYSDSIGDKYSRLVNSTARRQTFVTHALRFLEEHGFDGLDFGWQYPVCQQGDCKAGATGDREGYSLLLKELSSALKPKGLLLTATVARDRKSIDAGYDAPTLVEYLDWISIVTYDYHGWNNPTTTGHIAPLHHHPDNYDDQHNTASSIDYWISKGVPSRKIVISIPFYGRSFTTLNPRTSFARGVPVAGLGEAGEFTKSAGFLAYFEICDRIHNRNWTVIRDPLRRTGPYAYKENQWVNFDDTDMVRHKAEYIRKMNLGGVTVRTFNLDDFSGNCEGGITYPLMHTLKQILADPPEQQNESIRDSAEIEHSTPIIDVRSQYPDYFGLWD